MSSFVHVNTPKFIVLEGIDSSERSSLASSQADPLTFDILASPQNGTLVGSGSVLKYVPNTDYTGLDEFTFSVSDGATSDTATVSIEVAPFSAPIGIPDPEFGVDETYRMYDDPANRNPNLVYHQNAEGGYYTHYVDNTHPDATDSDNSYGTVTTPRLSVPRNLPEGSVVEIHNGANENGWGEFNVSGVGSQEKPIFVRGIDKPRITLYLDVGYYGNAQYIIVEGLSFLSGGILGRADGTTFTNSYVAIRNSELLGTDGGGGLAINSWTSNSISNIVLYNNSFHDNGVWNPDVASGDQDNHGISVGNKVSYLWVLDNEMYHNSGDGIQINSGTSAADTNHIYVGRNISHHNKQTGFWTKSAQDIIFSENISFGHRPSSSADGGGMGLQYDPQRVWFLFNKSYDNKHGIIVGSGNVGGRDEIYFIGNLIYDVTNGFSMNGLNPPTPAKIVNNTIYNAQNGVHNGYYNSKLDIVNNVIADCEYQVYLSPDYSSPSLSTMSYNLFNGPIQILWGATYTSLLDFQSATGEGQDCIEGDPEFVDSANNDFNLQNTSLAVDSGMESDVYQTFYDTYSALYQSLGSLAQANIRKDCAGASRPEGAEWDIGAFEYQSTPVDSIPVLPGALLEDQKAATVWGTATFRFVPNEEWASVIVFGDVYRIENDNGDFIWNSLGHPSDIFVFEQGKDEGRTVEFQGKWQPFSVTWTEFTGTYHLFTIKTIVEDECLNENSKMGEELITPLNEEVVEKNENPTTWKDFNKIHKRWEFIRKLGVSGKQTIICQEDIPNEPRMEDYPI